MEKLLQHCRENRLRVTNGLKVILKALQDAELPQSLNDLESNEALTAVCDRATIFRTLQRLEGIGLLRRLNFSHSAAKFTLKSGDGHNEYLICKDCGLVEPLKMACPVHKLEQDLSASSGFSQMTHELTFYGLCKECQ